MLKTILPGEEAIELGIVFVAMLVAIWLINWIQKLTGTGTD